MEFEEPRAAACEVEFLAHAHQTPSTTFVVGHQRRLTDADCKSGLPPRPTVDVDQLVFRNSAKTRHSLDLPKPRQSTPSRSAINGEDDPRRNRWAPHSEWTDAQPMLLTSIEGPFSA